MSVTLLEVLLAARARAVPLPAESAGYLLLSLSEKAVQAPRRIELSAVELDAEGGVQILAGEAVGAEPLEQGLRQALSELLTAASSPGPSLLRAAARPATGQLEAFVGELERALVPVNRTAARRALVRLCRETERARREGLLAPPAPATAAVPAPVAEPVTSAALASMSPASTPIRDVTPLEPQVEPAPVLPPVNVVSPQALSLGSEAAEPSTRPDTVVALSDSRRPAPPQSWSERTPYIGSIGLDVIVMPAPVVIESAAPSPDLPTVAPPPYDSVPPAPRGVGELVAEFEIAAGMSDDSLRAELKRVAGVEGTPGPDAVASRARRAP
jgi:hypothetical protein